MRLRRLSALQVMAIALLYTGAAAALTVGRLVTAYRATAGDSGFIGIGFEMAALRQIGFFVLGPPAVLIAAWLLARR